MCCEQYHATAVNCCLVWAAGAPTTQYRICFERATASIALLHPLARPACRTRQSVGRFAVVSSSTAAWPCEHPSWLDHSSPTTARICGFWSAFFGEQKTVGAINVSVCRSAGHVDCVCRPVLDGTRSYGHAEPLGPNCLAGSGAEPGPHTSLFNLKHHNFNFKRTATFRKRNLEPL